MNLMKESWSMKKDESDTKLFDVLKESPVEEIDLAQVLLQLRSDDISTPAELDYMARTRRPAISMRHTIGFQTLSPQTGTERPTRQTTRLRRTIPRRRPVGTLTTRSGSRSSSAKMRLLNPRAIKNHRTQTTAGGPSGCPSLSRS